MAWHRQATNYYMRQYWPKSVSPYGVTSIYFHLLYSSLWRHNGLDGVSNHQPHDCLLNLLFRCWSQITSKLRVIGLCAGNSPATGEFPAKMARNAENISIWWRHHAQSSSGKIVVHRKQITTTLQVISSISMQTPVHGKSFHITCLSEGNLPVTGGLHDASVMRSFHCFFVVCMNKLLNKQLICSRSRTPWRWWNVTITFFLNEISLWQCISCYGSHCWHTNIGVNNGARLSHG